MIYVKQLGGPDAAAYQAVRLKALQESPTAFSSSYQEEYRGTLSEIEARVIPAPDGSVCVFGPFEDDRVVGLLAENEPAKRLYQAAGFRYVGTDPEALRVGATYYDQETYVLSLAKPMANPAE